MRVTDLLMAEFEREAQTTRPQQLPVYLRLLDVPVSGSYGPTADER